MTEPQNATQALHSVFVRYLAERGASVGDAQQLADDLVGLITDTFPGEQLYIGRRRPDRAAVRAAFNGRNHREVCAEFGISQATLYRYIQK